MDIYKTLKKLDNVLSQYDGYNCDIYHDNKTYSSVKKIVEKEDKKQDQYVVGFHINSDCEEDIVTCKNKRK